MLSRKEFYVVKCDECGLVNRPKKWIREHINER